jgi:hypothetical protein
MSLFHVHFEIGNDKVKKVTGLLFVCAQVLLDTGPQLIEFIFALSLRHVIHMSRDTLTILPELIHTYIHT